MCIRLEYYKMYNTEQPVLMSSFAPRQNPRFRLVSENSCSFIVVGFSLLHETNVQKLHYVANTSIDILYN